MKFKIGDKVKVLLSNGEMYKVNCYEGNKTKGDVCTVTQVNRQGVKVDGECRNCWILEEHVERAYPNPPHKHHDLIVEWAKGAEIESKDHLLEWRVSPRPLWYPEVEYRVKPTAVSVNQERLDRIAKMEEELAKLKESL